MRPMILLMKKQYGADITMSYDDEKAVMCMALEWLLSSREVVAICIESKSLLKAIQTGSADTSDRRRILGSQTTTGL